MVVLAAHRYRLRPARAYIHPMHSLRSRLWVLWALTFAASIAVGLLLVQLYRASTSAELGQAEAVAQRACGLIGDSYAFYVAGWNGTGASPDEASFRRDLTPVIDAALARQRGVAGGIWSSTAGSLAEAFPTSPTRRPMQSLTSAQRTEIASVNGQAANADAPVIDRKQAASQALIVAACPLGGPFSGMTAWALTEVRAAPVDDRLTIGLAVLFALVVGIAGWVTWLTAVWGRHVAAIETALAEHDLEALPRMPPTGERELDRIVAALNEAARRLWQARLQSDEMAAKVAVAERLAALGRVAAGVAHEIRNPMAAMRLRMENALHGDAARQRSAIETSLAQIARVDALITELLATTQRQGPAWQEVALAPFLDARAQEHGEAASAAGLRLDVAASPATVRLDPQMIGRAVDNILLNAIRHTPSGGCVSIRAEVADALLRIVISDTGGGIAPDLKARLFEPFATGRPEGTGLGLAIAREMVEAHGGRLSLGESGTPGAGAIFVIELPVG
ncbi:MAG: HAMP domain-containing histidine kinase [Proteobacteria bacterium]|nr:HAMP domain-containing histidine kinase [Pseudomonadota bacterium]